MSARFCCVGFEMWLLARRVGITYSDLSLSGLVTGDVYKAQPTAASSPGNSICAYLFAWLHSWLFPQVRVLSSCTKFICWVLQGRSRARMWLKRNGRSTVCNIYSGLATNHIRGLRRRSS